MRLNVTLTGTTTPALAADLPVQGELEVTGTGDHSVLVGAVFRPLDATGQLGPAVAVARPEFTYDPMFDRTIARARADAAAAAGDCGSQDTLQEAVLDAVRDTGARGARVDDIARWIMERRSGGPVPPGALLRALDSLCNRGEIWQEGARGPYFMDRQDCPDCETEGVNCLAHREDSVGRIARSGR